MKKSKALLRQFYVAQLGMVGLEVGKKDVIFQDGEEIAVEINEKEKRLMLFTNVNAKIKTGLIWHPLHEDYYLPIGYTVGLYRSWAVSSLAEIIGNVLVEAMSLTTNPNCSKKVATVVGKLPTVTTNDAKSISRVIAENVESLIDIHIDEEMPNKTEYRIRQLRITKPLLEDVSGHTVTVGRDIVFKGVKFSKQAFTRFKQLLEFFPTVITEKMPMATDGQTTFLLSYNMASLLVFMKPFIKVTVPSYLKNVEAAEEMLTIIDKFLKLDVKKTIRVIPSQVGNRGSASSETDVVNDKPKLKVDKKTPRCNSGEVESPDAKDNPPWKNESSRDHDRDRDRDRERRDRERRDRDRDRDRERRDRDRDRDRGRSRDRDRDRGRSRDRDRDRGRNRDRDRGRNRDRDRDRGHWADSNRRGRDSGRRSSRQGSRTRSRERLWGE
jgi:hypothetical protein